MVKAIQVSDESYKKLESLGRKGDTFDMIVSKLLKKKRSTKRRKILSELRDGDQE